MARIRDPNRDKAFELYKEHRGKIDLVEIANQLNVPQGTVRGWKAKDKWDSKLNGTFQKNTERSKSQGVPKKTQTTPKNKEVEEEVEQLDNSGLTDKQKLFCVHYSKCFNATKAYQKAYGVDYTTATSIAYRLMENDGIVEEIKRLKQSKLNQVMLSPEDIFQKYMDIAFSDMTDYLTFGRKEIVVNTDEDGNEITTEVNYVDFKDSHQVDGTLISEVKQGKDGVSIKLVDRTKALQWLADHMDLATEEQKARIAILKAKVNDGDNEEIEDDGFMDALKGKVSDIWQE